MIPMKSALAQGKSILSNGSPLLKVSSSSRFQLRDRTAILWNRKLSNKFSNKFFLTSKDSSERSNEFVVKHANKAAATVSDHQKHVSPLTMKWAVLTGVTIVIGTILLVSRNELDEPDREQKQNQENNNNNKKRYKRIKIFNNNWLFFCYSTLPLNAISRLWGKVNSLTLPLWLRPIGYRFYSYLFDVNLDEMIDPDFTHYANLSEFFYRNIKPEVRPIETGGNVIVCPSDGRVLQIGIIDSDTGEIEQVKGLTYSIREFLGTHSNPLMSKSESTLDLTAEETKHKEFAKINDFKLAQGKYEDGCEYINIENEGDKSVKEFNSGPSKTVKLLSELSLTYPSYRFNSLTKSSSSLSASSTITDPVDTELYFAVIYLAPGDYHHFHSPIDWVCKIRRHFPGDLFSVAPYFQRNFPNLFVLNERVSLLGYWKYGFFSMTPVGATNVGSIKLNFDKELITNVKRNKLKDPHICYEAIYENASKVLGGMPLIKGEEMGGFELGSTVVLCFEAPKTFKFNMKVGEKVKMGQKLGTIE
ncbi:phosphatidylserine decarboxylase 1 NDAI_0F03290 [Naumovozyma dairenensis CBS 421]|uniref:Phosphatidylserine decarboxylase proenzyme 1, mitochondrial n=1 Tax=Naumovozyma dairenensis (strain ATCC 10597 / BCRC 20456 / CBS 421 / NBRC 0211 / NRRL Y-12639) TaxID=1071378 RepID=G0WCY6_NAUDC|nr:hypothetical protein NDAI_0F03290 [Naumovozyma dairenensis CBS 421]CCD25647.1 hypothetical protein NDAI_0F03290 [Naumovozyma dairenensis CBS 421]